MRVPNAVFSYSLSPAGLRIYCAILSLMGHKDIMELKQSTIANRAALSVRTVQRELPVLASKGLITITTRYIKDRATGAARLVCARYTIHKLTGAYFNIDHSLISKAGVSTSAFLCHAFLSKCSSKSKRAFPSLNKISKVVELCKATVIKAINELEQLAIIIKKQYVRLCGCFGCNQYVLQDDANEREENTAEKEKAHTLVAPKICAVKDVTRKVSVFRSILTHTVNVCQGLFCKLSYFFRL